MATVDTISMSAIQAVMEARIAPVLVGAPGVGKTAMIRELSEKMGYHLITVLGSTMDPTDVAGLPKGEEFGVDPETGAAMHATVYLMPWWQVEIVRRKKVILFLDEFSNTSPSVRASMLTLLQNRQFPNGVYMPEETLIVVAMNPAEQAADGYELDLPTSNRLFFIAWEPSAASWFEGMATNWGKEMSDAERLWKNKIVSFLKKELRFLEKLPEEMGSPEAYGKNATPAQMEIGRSAWASRRSWDNLSRILAHAPNDVSIQDTIMQGTVGFSAASAFREWLRRNSVIDPVDVINGNAKFDWRKASLDDSHLMLRSIVDLVDADNILNVANIFADLARPTDKTNDKGQKGYGRADLGAPFIKSLIGNCNQLDFGGKKDAETGLPMKKVVSDHILKKVFPLYKEVTAKLNASTS